LRCDERYDLLYRPEVVELHVLRKYDNAKADLELEDQFDEGQRIEMSVSDQVGMVGLRDDVEVFLQKRSDGLFERRLSIRQSEHLSCRWKAPVS